MTTDGQLRPVTDDSYSTDRQESINLPEYIEKIYESIRTGHRAQDMGCRNRAEHKIWDFAGAATGVDRLIIGWAYDPERKYRLGLIDGQEKPWSD